MFAAQFSRLSRFGYPANRQVFAGVSSRLSDMPARIRGTVADSSVPPVMGRHRVLVRHLNDFRHGLTAPEVGHTQSGGARNNMMRSDDIAPSGPGLASGHEVVDRREHRASVNWQSRLSRPTTHCRCMTTYILTIRPASSIAVPRRPDTQDRFALADYHPAGLEIAVPGIVSGNCAALSCESWTCRS